MSTALRDTGPAAYADGRSIPRPREFRVLSGAGLRGRHRMRADVCVIGTGAGGAPVAKELAEGGLDVVMLEEGELRPTDDFTARPREMNAALYRDGGQTATVGNVPILLPLGRGVGGTTTVNSGTCFRTPAPVLERWRREFGLELDAAVLDPFFRRVEREINVAQVPAEVAGGNAAVARRGAEALGWSGDYLFRNVRGCVGSGVCAFGCPTSAKQHMGLSYVPRAWDAGAVTVTGARARRVLVSRAGRATGVLARTAAGGRLEVRCDQVVVACGAIHTPVFLAGQRLGRGSGQLGRNLSLHPATSAFGLFDEPVDMGAGVPQSYFVDEFASERIMLEGAAGPPDYLAAVLPFTGERHRDLMLRYRHIAQFGLMVSDRSRGRVLGRGGRVVIRYDLSEEDVATFAAGLDRLAQLLWAAGAREVYLPVPGAREPVRGDERPVSRRRLRARDLKLMAFHPLGTARADARGERGVVDGDLRLRGVSGVHVADGSVIPSALGVNPQLTIMALATRLAFHLLGRPAPEEEPHPDRTPEIRARPPAAMAGAAHDG